MLICCIKIRFLLRRNLRNGSAPSTLAREISATVDATRDVCLWNQILQWHCRNGLQQKVLLLYQEMRLAGLHPNASTYPSLLGSCGKDLQMGQQFHNQILKAGCESDPYVGSSLLHLYASCEKIEDARKLFDEMPQRNLVLWTALIQGYARIGKSGEAISLFNRMQSEDGIKPNAVSVVSLFPFNHFGDGKVGFEFEFLHAFVIKRGLESDSLVGTSLTEMYMKCRAVENASRVFNGLRSKSAVSWLVMVSGLARNGLVHEAVSVVAQMRDLGVMLDSTAAVNLVSACADAGDIECGRWVHCYMIKTGLELDTFVGTALLVMYAKCGFLGLTQQVFDKMSERNLVAWNAIIHTYAYHGLSQEVKELFGQIRQAGLSPDSITIRSLLVLVSDSSSSALFGECIHGYSIKCGFFYSDITMVNSLLDFYAKVGDVHSARKLFLGIMSRSDTVSWNSMISGYVQNGCGEEAMRLFTQMQPARVSPDSFTLSSVLAACASVGEWSFGQYVHGYLLRHGYCYCELDTFVGTALVDMYGKCGDVKSAYKVFCNIPLRDTPMWNAMVSGYSQNGYTSEALALFYCHLRDMNNAGSSLSESALTTAVSACAQSGSLEVGKCLHGYALRNGLEHDVKVGNAILSMYSKCGVVEDAELFFKRMVETDATSWTAMISGYGINGRVGDAVFLFEEMTTKGKAEPNQITFLEVLWACSHGGLVKDGWGYFEMMRKQYGIKAKVEHYCCVVDLLGRGGYVYEAYVLVRSMSMKADAAIWGALLGACKIHGELELGEITGREILRLEGNSGYNVLFSNVYASNGLWEEAASVREDVTVVGLKEKKPPAWSCIEIREISPQNSDLLSCQKKNQSLEEEDLAFEHQVE